MLLGVDVGGTFTDAVLVDGDRVHAAKAPTTPDDQAAGVLDAIDAVLRRAEAEPGSIRSFAHGMTVGTNALLERRGARTALVATAGFTDLLEIARQDRPSLYRLCEDRPAPLSPPELRVAAAERIGPDGVVEELTASEIERIVAEIGRLEPESVAICLLHSYRDPAHEERVASAIRQADPGLHVSVSSEVLPQFREYERCATTVLDAYLTPLLAGYLRSLTGRCRERGIPEPSIMRSSGGVVDATEASRGGAWSVLSGPAGGAVGAGLIAALSGDGNALGLDMGGTSCDVCVVSGGTVGRTDGRDFDGRPIQLPMVDVHTVGAGGGSIGWADAGGALRVGPRSAGADPGPACYGRGGTEPTVTDANLLLGRLDPEGGLAGDVGLDRGLAEEAVERLADRLGLDVTRTAEGIVEVADQEMVRALRVVTVERGIDPRDFALMPFGGAGPLHAAAIAGELGIDRILCPRFGGVLSAVGLVASERRRDLTRTVMLADAELNAEAVAAAVSETAGRLDPSEGSIVEAVYGMRYRGQSFELPIAGPVRPDPEVLATDFAAEHERRYGYRDETAAVELVDVRVTAREPREAITPAQFATGEPRLGRREVRVGGSWTEAETITGPPPAGFAADGPCVFHLPESTLLLPAGWSAEVDDHGTIVASRAGGV